MITTKTLISNSGGDTRRVMSGLNAYINSDPAVREFVSAYNESDSQTQEIVKKMIVIICDESADQEEIELAQETVIEALFPNVAINFEDEYDSACETVQSQAAEKELDREEEVFAHRLRELMEERGMKQDELATTTGVSQSAISNILNRACRPRRSTVAKFAAALGVKLGDLWPQ